MIVEATRSFAAEQLRPNAAEAEAANATSPDVLKRAVNELGVTLVGVPEELGGMGNERSVTTGVLVAEALAHGDMGQAVAILAPAAVSNALVLWGDEAQQATYLPPFVGDDVPAAALAVLEPTPLFDPFTLKTTAPARQRLRAQRRQVAGPSCLLGRAVRRGRRSGWDARAVHRRVRQSGVSIEAEPAMGLRRARAGSCWRR